MAKYLIIGNSAGAIGAAEAIRSVDPEGPLTVVSEEPQPAYSRPILPFFLAGERSPEQVFFRPLSFYREKGIDLRLGRRAVALYAERQSVELDNGERETYEQLLLAPGARPADPDAGGVDLEGVFNFYTLEDARRLAEALPGARRAVVLGGGLIALSVAKALVRRSLEVTVVARSSRVLTSMVDEEGSRLAEAALAGHGVLVVANSGGAEIVGRPGDGRRAGAVNLGRGVQLPADLVVLARGTSPRSELVLGTPVRANRGIIVDHRMATTAPSVYACGDAAAAYDGPGGGRVAALWLNAYTGGKVAGLNMAGRPAEFPAGTGMACLDVMGLPMIAAGTVSPPATDGYQQQSRGNHQTYQKVVTRQGRVVGMVLVGDIKKSGLLYGLMRHGLDVTDFAGDLLEPHFGMAQLPQELRQELQARPEPALTGL